MTLDRRERLEAARDRYHIQSTTSSTVCLLGEARGVAVDLTRLSPRPLKAILDALGNPTDTSVSLAPAGTGSGTEAALMDAIGALANETRTWRIETGIDDLMIGFPWLEGRTPEGTRIRAPLFLYPATLEPSAEGPWTWVLGISGAPWLNEPLCALYRRQTRVKLAYEDFLAHDEDGLFKADESTWQGFTKTLQRAGVTLADTPPKLPAKPAAFGWANEQTFAAIPAGQYRLSHQVVLARMPMLAANLASDFEGLIASGLDQFNLAAAEPLLDIKPLAPGNAGRPAPRPHDDRGIYGANRRWAVLPTDPWQDEALRVIEGLKEGGLVIEGPPGTGKSQLIANLVAASLVRGDRVLVTSSRRGALDDVRARLTQRGLGEPLAFVGDPWRDRTPVCAELTATADPIVNTLDEVPRAEPESQRVGALEKELAARLDQADQAWDAVSGADQRFPGLAELDERYLADPIEDTPDLADCVESVTADELEVALHDIAQLAPHAAPYVAPHPLSLRTNWAALDAEGVGNLYADVDQARSEIGTWASLPGPLLPLELDKQRAIFDKVKPIVDLARGDDPQRLRVHAEVRQWIGRDVRGCIPDDSHRAFVAELRADAGGLKPVPAELVRLPAAELATRITNLDKLHKHESSGLRVFTPAYWGLKKLPEKYVATLPADTTKEAGPLAELHREAERWQRTLEKMPDLPAFALPEVGVPALLMELVQRLERAISEADAEARVAQALGSRFPPRPDWMAHPPARRAQSPFLSGLVEEHRRAFALGDVYDALEALRPHFDPTWFSELRVLARDAPAEAEVRLGALAATAADGPRVAMLDRTTSTLPAFVDRFLRQWAGPTELAVRACRRAVEEGWRALRIAAWGGTAVEAPLVDPRELRALADAMTQLEDARAAYAYARWKERIGALMEVEAQRQDLVKILAEVGRKRLRASLKQIVERHWKRGLAHLRPVWLTPLDAVASVFPRDRDTFDLVIIDEVNRAGLEALIPALVRTRRVVVLGDPFQAPPSPAPPGQPPIAAGEVPAWHILQGAFPTTSLRWGWGCRREELWIYPDAGWYGGVVEVVANVERKQAGRTEGLVWTRVDGRWRDGENAIEAEKVIDRIAEVFDDTIGDLGDVMPSVAVATTTRAQAALIRTLIDVRAARDEHFRACLRADRQRPESEQLVVGDLESLPPDRRDVLILSLVWAPPEGSKRVTLEFGQLAQQDGDALINGVITRARYGLHIVASCHDAALDAGRRPELGVKLTAFLMAYALGISLKDERVANQALADARAATGVAQRELVPVHGIGDYPRQKIAEEFAERGLGIDETPLTGPLGPDLTIAPTPKSPPRAALQSTRWLTEGDTLLRDLWSRRMWQRQGWTLIRVTPGVWRSSPMGVVRALEKLFSRPARLDETVKQAAETRAQVERLKAEFEAAQAAERAAEAAREAHERAEREAIERAEQDAIAQAERDAIEQAERAARAAAEPRRLEEEAAEALAAERVRLEQEAEAEAARLEEEARASAEAEAARLAEEARVSAEAEAARLEEEARAAADAEAAARAIAEVEAEERAREAAEAEARAQAAEQRARAAEERARAAEERARAAEAEAVARAAAAEALAAQVHAAPVAPASKPAVARPPTAPIARPPSAPIARPPSVPAMPATPPVAKPPSGPSPIVKPPTAPVARPPTATAMPIAKPPAGPSPIARPPTGAITRPPTAPAMPAHEAAPTAPATSAHEPAPATPAPAPTIAKPPTAPVVRPPTVTIAKPPPIAKPPVAPIAKPPTGAVARPPTAIVKPPGETVPPTASGGEPGPSE
ncbi:MAG: DUF4011 domain-containing protein [Deltaproteobacteria bacterium]|nr:DUF4011 domain-containing protein [Deltaproteobacteria bacterium]